MTKTTTATTNRVVVKVSRTSLGRIVQDSRDKIAQDRVSLAKVATASI